jgi:hypothetical protein
MAALAASRSTKGTAEAGILSSDPQHSTTPTLQTGLAGLQGPSPMFTALGQLRGFGSQSSVSLSFSLSGTPPGRNVSRLSGGVIGGRCIGLNEKAK